MKKAIIAGGVLSLLGVGAVIMAGANDNQIIKDTIEVMTAEDINGPAKQGVQTNEPDLTTEIVQQVVIDLQNSEALGGHAEIARKNGISSKQVKKIWKECQKRLSDIAKAEEEP